MRSYLLLRAGRIQIHLLICFAGLLLLSRTCLTAADSSDASKDLLTKVKTAYASGKRAEALTLANQAIEKDPTNAVAYFVRGSVLAGTHQSEKALTDFNQALKLDAGLAEAWQNRGIEHFKLGHINESIADFDRFISLRPEAAPYHWQRGIAYYYAKKFEEGRKQFELHQTVNSNDVENAVWHFLCVARSSGLEQARASLIPIQGDTRVPMMEVHALFAGKAKAEDVMESARAGRPSELELNRRLFYAHLYLGLYFEASHDETRSLDHISKAAGPFRTDDYMGDVARVHLQLQKEKTGEGKGKSASDTK
jgi:lipoprotein NlpI